MNRPPKFTNDLVHESSPYLLQHAHNPVNWVAWKPEVLERAEIENKLLLISIGYAACHWCHVMEKECFEDEEVASVMNAHFINIKIDREERPDVDHIYMDALQMMTGQGGWPLNIIALPDGRPFWGATFVKKRQWIQVLEQLSALYKQESDRIKDYASDLARGIRQINLIEDDPAEEVITTDEMSTLVDKWYRFFDTEMGGYRRAPKFMMPVNLNFLMRYSWHTGDTKISEYVNTTLRKMAYGGVFDHVGGGFARYSVDMRWHVPHFEKMLYDNAQLVSLYARAYAHTGDELYAGVVRKTIGFLSTELVSPEGGFYSSLDADSLDEKGMLTEGAYYVWKEQELQEILGEDFSLFADYFNINPYGHWEDGNYVLIRDKQEDHIAGMHQTEVANLKRIIDNCLQLLHERRQNRDRPRLDDKILCSWNGLILKGLTDAYRYLGDELFLELARKTVFFLHKNFRQDPQGLYHSYKEGKSSISGYLEDYAALIDGLIGFYEITYEEKWLLWARDLAGQCLQNYFDPDSGLFYFSSLEDKYTIRRTLETEDNVVPASNSTMCINLFKLSRFFLDTELEEKSKKMIRKMQKRVSEHPESHANWLDASLNFSAPNYEIAIVGKDFRKKARAISKEYHPHSVLAASVGKSKITLLQNRMVPGKTPIYLCEQGSCQLPTDSVEKVLEQLQNH